MASSLPRIALAGATGNLGQPILAALLEANYPVTVLSRIGGNSSKLSAHPTLTIKQVDFTSVPSMTDALHDAKNPVEIVISCLATHAIGAQNPLIDAAVAVDVKRFIPAEFGMDSMNELSRALPVCAPKAATQAYLHQKSQANPEFSWTGIANGLFLDWCLEAGIILDVKRRAATLYNGGDVRFSATLLRDVARAVLGVIEKRCLEGIRNRIVYVHSKAVSQDQLIRYAMEKDKREWDVVVKSTEEVRKESLDELSKGDKADVDGAMLGFCIVGSWDPEYGCDFSGRLDNGLLGVKELSEGDLRRVMEELL
ncbi:aromatic alcohol reductase [Aspergillus undulatus]|uniref:aromatic alcohol reductase n=1 Tax=Aspergillus undulatus TaxID=1810928 RepID=UPI003CCE39E7